eukprot:TRINITY_DN72939_c0_g1_i1.p1 TRINITY_DN72939_c0_g1~~TRINITY_DN72939_c0_g1_i1.p1  ORF type:complete len:1294 (-),score=169.11 TRINITY_DN72939_c0_g1_i1:134-4015(-)
MRFRMFALNSPLVFRGHSAAALEFEYVRQWRDTPHGVAADLVAALLVFSAVPNRYAATAAALITFQSWRWLNESSAFARSREDGQTIVASVLTTLVLVSAFLGVLAPSMHLASAGLAPGAAAAFWEAEDDAVAGGTAAAAAAAFLVGSLHQLQRSAQLAVLGCVVTGVAALLGSGHDHALPVAVLLVVLGLGSSRSRRDGELTLRAIFLEERRAVKKAQQFYSLLADMLPPQLVHRYFELCLSTPEKSSCLSESEASQDPCNAPESCHRLNIGLNAIAIAERRPRCGVLFVAICDFDELVRDMPPKFVVRFLDKLFCLFDDAVGAAGPDVTKVETVGEVHVSASGLFLGNAFPDDIPGPESTTEDQVACMARLALQMHDIAADHGATLRAGLHCGPVVAGVVGDKLPRFRLFGDTVNVAARLEQHCPPGQLLLSAKTAGLLTHGDFHSSEYGSVHMKGLGDVDVVSVQKAIPCSPPTADKARANRSGSVVQFDDQVTELTYHATQPPSTQETHTEDSEGLASVSRLPSAAFCESRVEHSYGALKDVPPASLGSTLSTTCRSSLRFSLDGASTISSGGTPSSRFSWAGSDDDSESDDDIQPPACRHLRTKTPTEWLSVQEQLGHEAAARVGRNESGVDDTPPQGASDGPRKSSSTWAAGAGSKRSDANQSTLRSPSGGHVDDGDLSSQDDTDTPSASVSSMCSQRGCPGGSSAAQLRLRRTRRRACTDVAELSPQSLPSSRTVNESAPTAADTVEDSASPWGFSPSADGRPVAEDPVERKVRQRLEAALQDGLLGGHKHGSWRRTDLMTCFYGLASLLTDGVLDPAFQDEQLAQTLAVLGGATLSNTTRLGVHLLAVGLAACSHLSIAWLSTWTLIAAVVPWIWSLLCVLLRLPFLATLAFCSCTALAALSPELLHAPSRSHILATVALLVLQLANQLVQKRRFLIQRLEFVTTGRMQGVARNLMPPGVIQELRSTRFGLQAGERSRGEHADRVARIGRAKTMPNVTSGITSLPSTPPCRAEPVAHRYEFLTILQADLAGFTAFARSKAPEEVVCVVNGLFSIFDGLVDHYGLYKMEMIGDAYICVSGLPDYNQGRHSAAAALLLGCELVQAVARYKTLCSLPKTLGLRAGVHSGSCVGGIVGSTMQRYHLFGRTMRIVELLESSAPTNGVHLSESTQLSVVREISAGDIDDAALRIIPRPPGHLETSKGQAIAAEDVDFLNTFLLDFESAPHQSSEGSDKFDRTDGFSVAPDTATEKELVFRKVPTEEPKSEQPTFVAEQMRRAVSWHARVAR